MAFANEEASNGSIIEAGAKFGKNNMPTDNAQTVDIEYEDTFSRTWLESFYPYHVNKFARAAHYVVSIGGFIVFGYLGMVGERALWVVAIGLGVALNPHFFFWFLMVSGFRASSIRQSLQVKLDGRLLTKIYCSKDSRVLDLSKGYDVHRHAGSNIVLQGTRCFAFPDDVWDQLKNYLPVRLEVSPTN